MNYDYDEFDTDIKKIVRHTKLSNRQFLRVMGFSRGGLVPGVCISHALEVPFEPIIWSSTEKEKVVGLTYEVADNPGRILLVDDILDSGNTINSFLCYHNIKREDVAIAVLLNNISQEVVPDYFGRTIDRNKDKRWIHFWWENQ